MNLRWKQFLIILGIAFLGSPSARAMTTDEYHAYLDQQKAMCDSRGDGYELRPSGIKKVMGADGKEANQDDVICRYSSSNNDSYYNNRRYGGGSNSQYSDPSSNCNSAQRFDAANGMKCVSAENTIQSVKGRNNAMIQMDTTAAGAIQVATAMKTPQTQQEALDQQKFNLKATIATTLLETGMHGYNAAALNNAADDAQSAARGIKNAQQVYDDAANAGANAAGQVNAKYRGQFRDRLSVANSEQQLAAAGSSSSRGGGYRGVGSDNYLQSQILQNGPDNEKKAMEAGAKAFNSTLSQNGLDQSAQGFDSYQQMRGATNRGITESKTVMEQANSGASESTMLAMGSALQSAEAIAQLRQLQNIQTGLQPLPGSNPIALDTPGVAPTTPQLPTTPTAYAPSPAVDPGSGPVAAQPRQPVQGNIQAGQGFANPQFKPRVAQATSGGGGRGVGGGGGGGASKAPPGRSAIGPSSADYGGGGGRLNAFGGAGGGAPGPNSDLQEAIKSILGGGEKKDANTQIEGYRELASAGDKPGEDGSDDSRSIFERVNAKYGDLQNNGVI